MTLEERD